MLKHTVIRVKMELEGKIISVSGGEISYCTFVNKTKSTVTVNWFNYEGKLVRYSELKPGETYGSKTFVGHPWACINVQTNKTMFTGGDYVFYPKASTSHVTVSIEEPRGKCQRSDIVTGGSVTN